MQWLGKRYGVFYLLGCVASAFAGILAFGLMQMAGLQGLNGWRCVLATTLWSDSQLTYRAAGSLSSRASSPAASVLAATS